MTRDSQRAKVYKAERATGLTNARISRLEVELFVRDIVDSYEDLYWPLGVEMTYAESGHAKGYRHGILLPRWAMSKLIVCHELAHVVRIRQGKGIDEASHGPEFCQVYLDLVGRFCQLDWAEMLKFQFDAHGVVVDENDAQRVKLLARIERMKQQLKDLED